MGGKKEGREDGVGVNNVRGEREVDVNSIDGGTGEDRVGEDREGQERKGEDREREQGRVRTYLCLRACSDLRYCGD